MIKASFDVLVGASPRLRRFMIHGLYEVLARLDRGGELTFMNYGYRTAGDNGQVALDPSDEPSRWAVQLYHHVASSADLRGKHVLEIGSGRGGGASYLARSHAPASLIGIDISRRAVDFCRRHHQADGLSFAHADAENLPFDDNRFDVVVNVESSHGYGSLARFLSEVARVLRPGGYFLYADHRAPHQLPDWRAGLGTSAFSLVSEADITHNVLLALDADHARKLDLIDRRCPALLHDALREFAAVRGSRAYERFRTGQTRYFSFVLRKPDGHPRSAASRRSSMPVSPASGSTLHS